ncbi:MAG: hypothetical protein R2813_10675 [Flavobacteriales bacterium]
MPGLTFDSNKANQKLQEFLERWPLDIVKKMTLEQYNQVGNHDSFCYWLEHEAEILGRIGGKPSNKFGIWHKKESKQSRSVDFLEDEDYKWYAKYGSDRNEAFQSVIALIIQIIEASLAKDFPAIDGIDLDSLSRWKIAFIYSDKSLVPIYKKETVRKVARHLVHSNYLRARLSDLHQYIASKKPDEEDFFLYTAKQYQIATSEFDRNYYIIGSKYWIEEDKKYASILPQMMNKSVVSTGYLWGWDLSDLYNRPHPDIYKWMEKNIHPKPVRYKTESRALAFLLGLKPGDIIAIKDRGPHGTLTIVAYAEVKKVEGKVYEPDSDDYPEGLGHIIHVEFLETGLWIETGLTYGETIHKIIPGEREGHFEKIFGSYAVIEESVEDEIPQDEDDSAEEDRINDKDTDPRTRTVTYTATVKKTHDKIQLAFARQLKRDFPDDVIQTESNYIDVKRITSDKLYYYEVKPFNSAYACVRAGIGQLLDYHHSNPSDKDIQLCIVGPAPVEPEDQAFISFIQKSLKLPFEYIRFPIALNN